MIYLTFLYMPKQKLITLSLSLSLSLSLNKKDNISGEKGKKKFRNISPF